ncbi:MAG: undecaprenyldiphospho-muramoylpentapeptide beta-N-acetylglucosaminyltransferase [Lachnospiraceae bacterium]|nr:undecaprenyldiphospho-muramoylpentapeptide beta-N-acetylglucosaminyltransferase [Lachnospiraceae bacterium]
MKKIILTGGGTAGHVTPNIALLPYLKEKGFEVFYIGSKTGIEKTLIEEQGIPYYPISSGKLRRYFDPKNFSDPFRVIKGYFDAVSVIRKIKPDVIFSKGGFVSVPVVLASKNMKVPCIIHESDMTPGLANKIAIPSATKVCCNFPETVQYLPKGKAVMTGSPIRKELLSGDAGKAKELLGFSGEKPVLFMMGGSLGSRIINENLRKALPTLLEKFDIVHMCGKGNLDESLTGTPGYKQFEYIGAELPDIYALADLMISRAGANSICELLALKMPNLLIPLSAAASRGDQILNAASFEKQGFSLVLEEEKMTPELLTEKVFELYDNKDKYVAAMEQHAASDSAQMIADMLAELAYK